MGVFLKNRKAEKLKTEILNPESRKLKPETLKVESGKGTTGGGETSGGNFSISAFQFSAFALCAWILLTEFSVEAWYRSHEARVPAAAQWTVVWPAGNPAFKELPIAGVTRQILRYDEGRSASWQEGNITWEAVFLRWKPGRTAIHLAQNHTPEVCMTAAGFTLNAISPQEWFEVNGMRMPFLAYEVVNAPRPYFVFYCLWDDRATAQGFATMSLTYGNRLAPVLAGLRNPGQRSLEIAVVGPDTAAAAEAALRAELEKLVTVAKVVARKKCEQLRVDGFVDLRFNWGVNRFGGFAPTLKANDKRAKHFIQEKQRSKTEAEKRTRSAPG